MVCWVKNSFNYKKDGTNDITFHVSMREPGYTEVALKGRYNFILHCYKMSTKIVSVGPLYFSSVVWTGLFLPEDRGLVFSSLLSLSQDFYFLVFCLLFSQKNIIDLFIITFWSYIRFCREIFPVNSLIIPCEKVFEKLLYKSQITPLVESSSSYLRMA